MKFTTDEETTTLCDGLREAFDYFGGVPEHVLFDNAKSVVIDRDAYGEGLHRWNDAMKGVAETCGFKPRLCKPPNLRVRARSGALSVRGSDPVSL